MNSAIKSVLRQCGFEVRRLHSPLGRDPIADVRRLLDGQHHPVVLDVGANLGQTIEKMNKALNEPIVHSFEPSPSTFVTLNQNYQTRARLRLNNVALGAQTGQLDFLENSESDMSSFLPPSQDCWGQIQKVTSVPVTTVDEYCAQNQIAKIDVLKMDTQGYDFEVLKGAQSMLSQNKIHFVLTEVIFSDMYKGLPRFDTVYGFLADHGFELVSFYQLYYRRDLLSWTDALLINRNYK